jgi:hypothetical protein
MHSLWQAAVLPSAVQSVHAGLKSRHMTLSSAVMTACLFLNTNMPTAVTEDVCGFKSAKTICSQFHNHVLNTTLLRLASVFWSQRTLFQVPDFNSNKRQGHHLCRAASHEAASHVFSQLPTATATSKCTDCTHSHSNDCTHCTQALYIHPGTINALPGHALSTQANAAVLLTDPPTSW